MNQFDLTPGQLAIVHSPPTGSIFLSGPAGSGKTTVGVARLQALLAAGIPGSSILVLTPQRTLQEPYLDFLSSPDREAGSDAIPATIGGLARRVCDLFWPLAAEAAGFAHPEDPPVFLTLETSQYFMARLVRPLLERGSFDSVTIDRNRLYSQILDNLNKSAIVGFPYTEIGERLDSAYYGEPGQRRVYADAQDCASRFRQYCLEHNLLDFSLQLEIFTNILWSLPQAREFLTRSYRHLIYDNIEEDGPRPHDIIREWLPDFDSALLILDEGGGYRYFLGADVDTAQALGELCERHARLTDSFVVPEDVSRLGRALCRSISPGEPDHFTGVQDSQGRPDLPLGLISAHFYPELLDKVADEAHRLVADEGLPPSELVILAPFLSDALRFSLLNRLQARGVAARSHRPSRSLREEPASRTLLTLAALAHPGWGIHPPRLDVAYALVGSIEGMDLIRAQLLAEIVYRQREASLSSFDQIVPPIQERITFDLGGRYTRLRDWLLAYQQVEALPLDHFFRRLFGEVLSQPGFGFHRELDSVRVAASLVESVNKFRLAMEPADPGITNLELGSEYAAMLSEGVLAAQYLSGWQSAVDEAVLVAPAHTFLLMNRPARVQIWLDVGSSGWHTRLAQPLTHPYVLSRGWQPGRVWSDADEVETARLSLGRLVSGLLHRCGERIYVGLSELGESGLEQRGQLLRAFQAVIQEESE